MCVSAFRRRRRTPAYFLLLQYDSQSLKLPTCIYDAATGIQERLSVLAAPRMVRSTFLFAVYLSGGL